MSATDIKLTRKCAVDSARTKEVVEFSKSGAHAHYRESVQIMTAIEDWRERPPNRSEDLIEGGRRASDN